MDFLRYEFVIVILAAAFLLAGSLYFLKRNKKPETHEDAYVGALRKLLEKDEEGAFSKLQQAVRAGGAPTDAYLKLGQLLRERGEVSKALQIHRGLTVKSNLKRREKVELYLNLAEDYSRLGKSERSVEVLETAIKEMRIREPSFHAALAKQFHSLGKQEKAYQSLKELKRLGALENRNLALYLSSRAEKCVQEGYMKEARKLLQRALKHDPDCPPALLMLGDIDELSDNVDGAIERWKRVAFLSPELAARALGKLEKTLYERGRFGEIERIYKEILEARGDDESLNLSLASFYRKMGRMEETLRILQDFLARHPDSVGSLLLLISTEAKVGDTEAIERLVGESAKRLERSRRFSCDSCGFSSDLMRWHCPRCNAFDSFSLEHES